MRPGWLKDLPAVRGTLTPNAPLAPFTWFRVGGPADVLFQPADEADLADFLANLPRDVPVLVLGIASNVIIRDGGVEGVVIRLARGFTDIEVDGETVRAGAAAPDIQVAKAAQKAALGGLEFLRGIPGSVGGGLRMNAGAYGGEFRDILISARALDRAGKTHDLTPDMMGMSYRHTEVPDEFIFTQAVFQGRPGDTGEIQARMDEITQSRETTQPIREKTGGSTFKNPEGRKSWQLIDAAGCRGLKVGGAQVSEQHCNFLINTGNATAEDIETLGENVRARVKETSGVDLHWEIKRMGRRS